MRPQTILLLLALVSPCNLHAAQDQDHSQCSLDSECISITEIKQYCRHLDPAAKESCPVVNRKFAEEIASIDCFRTVGCRAVTNIRCRDGHCIADAG